MSLIYYSLTANIYSVVFPPVQMLMSTCGELGEYQAQDTTFPTFVDPDWIQGHLAMTTDSIRKSREKVWATIDLAKVCILHMASDLHLTYVYSDSIFLQLDLVSLFDA